MRNYPEEKGSVVINGHQMSWILRRSKGESAFGIRGSRIFELTLMKDGKEVAKYNKGWDASNPPLFHDNETKLCIDHLVQTFGREKKKVKESN